MLMYVLLWSADTMLLHMVDFVDLIGASTCRILFDAGFATLHSWLNGVSVLLWMYVRRWFSLDAWILWFLTLDVLIALYLHHMFYALPNCFMEC